MSEQQPLVDYHIHTRRCGHATGEMREYVERAIRAGLPEMGSSDHIFLYWLAEDARDPELAMPEQQFDGYVEEVLELRRAHRDIEIRLSVEADFIPGHEVTLRSILDRHPWDYVLGSVHFIDAWGLDDSRYLSTYDEWDIDDLYERYFDLVCRAAELLEVFDSEGPQPASPPIPRRCSASPGREPPTWFGLTMGTLATLEVGCAASAA